MQDKSKIFNKALQLQIKGKFSDAIRLYLKLIPYTWRLIDLRCQNNELLKDLRIFLHKYFSKKIRNKYGN